MDVDCSEFERGGYRYKRDTSDNNSTESTPIKEYDDDAGSSDSISKTNTDTNNPITTKIPDTNTTKPPQTGAKYKFSKHFISYINMNCYEL